jgi:phage/plasmid primase-like uncharacterized protein
MDENLKADITSKINLRDYFAEHLENMNAGHPEARADCPFQCEGGQRQTLRINLETGRFICDRCGNKGDLFAFHRLATEKDFKAALADLAAMAGVELDAGKGPKNGRTQRKEEGPAKKAGGIWSRAEETGDDHPYLKKKNVKNHGLRIVKEGFYDGALVMPLKDMDGKLKTVQYLRGDGEKPGKPRRQPEGRVSHHWWKAGREDLQLK